MTSDAREYQDSMKPMMFHKSNEGYFYMFIRPAVSTGMYSMINSFPYPSVYTFNTGITDIKMHIKLGVT
jgi:hypothetical protein